MHCPCGHDGVGNRQPFAAPEHEPIADDLDGSCSWAGCTIVPKRVDLATTTPSRGREGQRKSTRDGRWGW